MPKNKFDHENENQFGEAEAPKVSSEFNVKLLKPHTHEKRFRMPGELLTVDKPTRDWLIENKIGRDA